MTPDDEPARADQHHCPVCRHEQHHLFSHRGFQYWRCPRCLLVSTYPLPDDATIRLHYETRFKEGNYRLLREFAGEYSRIYQGFVDVLRERLTERGRSLAGASVLDIGCFTGDFLALAQKAGAEVFGIELQAEAVEIANQRLPGRVFQIDVAAGNFPVENCDAVCLLGVIEHVKDPLTLLTHAAKLIGPGGVLLLQTPDSRSWPARALGRFWPPYAPVEHIHLFSGRSLRTALTALGLLDVRIRPHWKVLPISYVYENMRNFGPELRRLVMPLCRLMPRSFSHTLALPFYGGEVIVTARKAG